MMYDFPLVTICVGTYNRPESLQRTLNSLINQTYSNIEVVLSNNASTDPKVNSVIEKFIKDTRIKYYEQPKNMGAAFNLNFIIDKANGEFFMRLGDDDWISENYVESCLKFLQNNQEYALAYGRSCIKDENENFVQYDTNLSFVNNSAIRRVLDYIDHVQFNGPYYGLIRSQYLKYAALENKLGIDWAMVSRIAFSGKIAMIENTNVYICTGGMSQTIENVTRNLNMSKFTQAFPYLKISLNVFQDICFDSSAYKKMPFFKRLIFAMRCGRIVFRKFNVASKLGRSALRYLQLSFGGHVPTK